MTSLPRRGGLAGPVLLIGFGTLVLLINLGRLPISIAGAAARLWPLALIAIGIDLLIPRRSILASVAVAGLLLTVVLGGGALALQTIASPAASVPGEAVRVPAAGPEVTEIRLHPSAGTLFVEAGSGAGGLVTGTVRLTGFTELETSESSEDGRRTVTLGSSGGFRAPVTTGPGEEWDLAIARGARLRLSVSMGAGEATIDATELALEGLAGSIGAGDFEVRLAAEPTTVDLSAAVGQIVIRVPRGASVRLEASTVLGGVEVPDDYTRSGNRYFSPDFDQTSFIDIDASLVIGEIRIAED